MSREIGLILACAGMVACLFFATWPFRENLRDNDFLHFYAGAVLSSTPDLYSVDAARGVMEREQPGAVFRPVVRPPFYYALARPLASLPYTSALAVWQVIGLACLVSFGLLWTRASAPVLALAGVFVPVWYGLALGQDATWFLCAAALAVFFMRRERPWAAGLVLSIVAAKAHVFLLVAVLPLCYGVSFFAGFVVGGVLLYGASAWMMSDWLWPLAYLEYLNSPTGGNIICRCEIDGTMLLAAGVLAAMLCAWLWRFRPPFSTALAVVYSASLLVAQRPFFYDAASLLPLAVVMLPKRWPAVSLGALVLAVAAWHWAGWPMARWAVAGFLAYSLFVTSRERSLPSGTPV